ncbi:hypothetical protein [Flavobacterium capsici]|uniref:Uncharacterized protein n=1 Tax=Flavobacterium capsici TaxID=3075618 RepID=A0AA96F145_9FLAO|nr:MULTISPECIES: hypothetical protein [unclassified Flavobacterium]WNM19261.1 hypothetical protein RN608_00930 [Flavobacterium sp. PMR2A8]WNM20650.1 hypothetical protein RN605_08100 [Flavobacterium sp. PMTSA4]
MIGSKEKSRIKMVILNKNGFANETVYSPLDQNRKSDEVIILGMLRRYQAKGKFANANAVHFYENGKLIQSIKSQ